MKETPYFVALIPPQQVCGEIINFKNDFANRFASSKALKVMPHITLKSPFRLAHVDHDSLVKWFYNLYTSEKPFEIQLKNFAVFHSRKHPVVYVEPVMNMHLYTLQNEISRSFKNSYPTHMQNADVHFRPHVTIAYRDLTPGKFREAWKEYKLKEYSASFTTDRFHLLQHDTTKWNVIETRFME